MEEMTQEQKYKQRLIESSFSGNFGDMNLPRSERRRNLRRIVSAMEKTVIEKHAQLRAPGERPIFGEPPKKLSRADRNWKKRQEEKKKKANKDIMEEYLDTPHALKR